MAYSDNESVVLASIHRRSICRLFHVDIRRSGSSQRCEDSKDLHDERMYEEEDDSNPALSRTARRECHFYTPHTESFACEEDDGCVGSVWAQ